jgi:DNA-binding NtrC family response regulator
MEEIHLLIIDDEPKWIRFVRDDLRKRFKVEVANNLDTTLAMLKKRRYDLIIASARYQDILKAIREIYPEEPVVVATGKPTTREAIDIYRLGVLDYFPKNFRSRSVSNKIDEVIRTSLDVPA